MFRFYLLSILCHLLIFFLILFYTCAFLTGLYEGWIFNILFCNLLRKHQEYLTLVANRPYLLAHLTLNITKYVPFRRTVMMIIIIFAIYISFYLCISASACLVYMQIENRFCNNSRFNLHKQTS
jgi:hypothetical protein